MKILLKGRDGSVAIMTLTEGADKEFAIKNFKDSHPDMYIDHFEFDGQLPCREFRDAWTHSGNIIKVDSVKAQEIHLGRIRSARDVELGKLDIEQLRHLSDVVKLTELEDKKQTLRDLPANVQGLDWPELLEKK